MVFSSSVFIFFFLSFVLLIYFLLKKRSHRNNFLVVMSLIFYGWGAPWLLIVMMGSITVNWLLGLLIAGSEGDEKRRKFLLVITVIFNIGLLSYYKYLPFVLKNINWLFHTNFPEGTFELLGISFFTFQAMSYVIDVYRHEAKMQKNILNVCLYVSLFPQLIAGPIVRYQTVADEIEERHENIEEFNAGARRFMVGLAKKTLLANNLALLANDAFALPASELSVAAAWLGAIAYLWQVYFDFSGYSDMAIGMGWMFGFHFEENFIFPMVSKSITEFWRRWHISLGTWFRDYLFFPLGGSRCSHRRAIFNMFVVWSLTGLWHGAKWTYVIWGIGFFVLLVLEKYTPLGKWMDTHPIGHLYAMVAMTTVTVIIRSDDMAQAIKYIGTMYGAGSAGLFNSTALMYLREYGLFVLAGIVVSLPVGEFIQRSLHIPENTMQLLRGAGLVLAIFVSFSYIIMGGYNPFIYANF